MILSIASQKGGVGKTTTAAALTTWAAMRGVNALAVDLDPQGNLTYILKGDGNGQGSYELLKGLPARQIIQTDRAGMPDIVPASLQLAGADAEYSNKTGRDFLLKRGLEPVKGRYGLIVIDTPPTLGTLLVNALATSDAVLVPVQADAFSLQGIFQLSDTIGQVRQYCNPSLSVAGIFINRYNGRTILGRDTRAALAEKCQQMGLKLFKTAIREGVVIREAQTMQQSLFTYSPRSKPARDFDSLFKELKIV